MATENDNGDKLRVLELFAGIGGLHWALKVASIPCEVVAAMEINTTVTKVYSKNFPNTNLLTRNISGITAKEINNLKVDAIVMSPPCQPFCRMGNRLDTEDARTGPLSQLTEILPDVHLKYIFVENVQGFETSTARSNFLKALKQLNFHWQEFLLTPKSLGVPNSRLRYYLIGKRQDIKWSFPLETTLLSEIPGWNDSKMPFSNLRMDYEEKLKLNRKRWSDEPFDQLTFCVGDIVEWNLPDKELQLKNSVLQKYYQAMDIVTPMSTSTCCVTKGYGKFVKGTGSVLRLNEDEEGVGSLRWFSPREVSRLMSYPDEFEFPEGLALHQKYRCLGNSVNVYVVAILLTLLFADE